MVDDSALANTGSTPFHPDPHDLTNGQAHSRFGIFGVDSVPNFNDHFFADGFDASGNPNRHWYTNTVGNPPQMGGTTLINAPVQPNALYSSGSDAIQITDAIQRAEYFDHPMKPDWHTLLNGEAFAPLTVHIRQATTCAAGFTGCSYYFALNKDGSCCRFILINIAQFDQAFAGAVVTDIVGNAITTQDISSFLFPNSFLYFTDRRACCVLGFHTYFFQPQSDPERRWVLNYSSWTTPGLFGPFFRT